MIAGARIEEVRELLRLPEHWGCLVGHQEPPAVLLLEHVRYESIEAESFAVLAQELHLLDTDGPRDLSISANVRFG